MSRYVTMSAKRRRIKSWGTLAAAIVTLIHITPIIVIILNSMRSNADIDKRMLGLPTGFNFENYAAAWVKGEYLQAYANSLIIGLSTAVIVLVITSLAVYGLTKTPCFFPNFFRNYFVAGLALPSFSILVPLFFFFNRMGLNNTLHGMVIIYTGTNISFNFMFLYAFFQGMPKELDEAARIDGASELQNVFYNVIPLAKPIFTSVLLIVFVNTWNEFLFSNTFLADNNVRTVSLRFYNFVGRTNSDYGYIYAAAIIAIIPIVVIYFIMQDSFVEGMTSGSVKG